MRGFASRVGRLFFFSLLPAMAKKVLIAFNGTRGDVQPYVLAGWLSFASLKHDKGTQNGWSPFIFVLKRPENRHPENEVAHKHTNTQQAP